MDLHWSQVLYVALLATALLAGRPGWQVSLVMVGNWLLSDYLAADPIDVAIADVAAAVILIGQDKRANIVAAIFCLMIPVYVADDYFALPDATTYTVIDVMAYVQLAVIGHVDGGLRRIGGAIWPVIAGRPPSVHRPLAVRDNPSGRHQPVPQERMTNGR